MTAVILPDHKVNGAVLSLASNVAPAVHLAACRQTLAGMGTVMLSAIHQNACQLADEDPQARVSPYHNQIAVVAFNGTMAYATLWQLTKQLERDNGRQTCTKPNVTLDVDILAVRTPTPSSALAAALPDAPVEVVIPRGDWQLLARRLPLPSYDKAGLASLPMPWAHTLQALFDV